MGNSVLIIGASRGLGLEFARQYAAAGWQVAGTVRGEAGAKALTAAAPGGLVAELDIRREEDFASVARELSGKGFAPSLLIHNAGVNPRPNATFGEITFDDFSETLAINVTGAVGSARYLMPLLPANQGARAAFITSELGSIALSNGSFLPYRASKAALNMLVKCLSAEQQARGVCCVALHPGWVRTDMGGPMAPLEAPDSIRRMRETIGSLTMERNGAYIDLDGKTLPF